MVNLKNITELPLAESADGLNLIVNDNGSAKQIAASAVGAQADFAVTDETSPAFIKNKPAVVQADWNQSDETSPAFIKNKPTVVQSDWNQNDETASDYVKNRPFYEDSYATATLFDGDITLIWHGMEQGRDYYYQFPSKLSLVNGTTYTIKCNDKSASIVCRNETIFFEPQNTPFGEGTQGYISNNYISVNYPTITSFHLWVGITENTIKTIDEKYIPNTIARKTDIPSNSDWNQNDPNASDYIKNKPFEEYVVPNILVEAETSNNNSLPSAKFIFGEEYIIEYDDVRYSLVLTQQYDAYDSGYFTGFNLSNEDSYKYEPTKADSSIPFLLSYRVLYELSIGEELTLALKVYADDSALHTIKIIKENVEVKTLDPKYLPDSVVNREPYVIDSEAYTYGDDALAAILEGRQILVKVPNKKESTLYSNFMPVLQYQLPDINNNYLSLFYLKDGIAENIMTAMQTGSFDGVYGTIEMMLSKTYAECPLKVSPIK